MRWRLSEGLEGLNLKTLSDYVYHLNVGPPCGELALPLLLAPGAWPRLPLGPRLQEIQVPIDFVYGEHDWMDVRGGISVAKHLLETRKMETQVKIVQIGRAVQQECRDRSRMPSSA
eukprot:TRINITY_DN10887_c0_g2_i2.p1 TRINITY_DN10887_c0_g2~~TRINITY_DN10887_c0_g2_i2.p1  ORF type:complete len:116 (-),score=17.80 TRINITY_DN10887_c0_g2_i2:11-358(-)